MQPLYSLALATIGLLGVLPSTMAWWIINCAKPVVIDRIDPIVSPGTIPSSHVHTFMGGDALSSIMTYADTQKSRCTTCSVTKDLSNYWAPTLWFRAENGSFISVQNSGGMLIYYQQRGDPLYKNDTKIHAFPEGFRMVAGSALSRKPSSDPVERRAVTFACLEEAPRTGSMTSDLPNKKCKNGLRAQVSFPSCWDGVHVDSPDHRSHVAYPSDMDNGVCPRAHPKRLMYLFYEVNYAVDRFDDLWHGTEQPFVFSHGDHTGRGYHGDFLNGWDVPLLQEAIDSCTEAGLERCGPLKPFVQTNKAASECGKDPLVAEQMTGVLPALPGCNPIQREHNRTQSCSSGAVAPVESQSAGGSSRMVRRLLTPGGHWLWRRH